MQLVDIVSDTLINSQVQKNFNYMLDVVIGMAVISLSVTTYTVLRAHKEIKSILKLKESAKLKEAEQKPYLRLSDYDNEWNKEALRLAWGRHGNIVVGGRDYRTGEPLS